MTYVTAGDPDLERTPGILAALARGGADVIELGIPFSDPLADGPVIQRASERALAAGTTLERALDMLASVRRDVPLPVVVFTYANPVLRLGAGRFAARAAAAGVDGVLVLDLPIEEAGSLRQTLSSAGIDTIFLLSPTTTRARIERAAALGRGFLYGISRLGVTGARTALSADAAALAERVHDVTAMPLAMGFGVSQPEHVAEIGRFADAAVVGSALVSVIAEAGRSAELDARVA
ncbi:MAG: tryptophan synthase subunit alpha, partial [Vicinamibacterales bacterium]